MYSPRPDVPLTPQAGAEPPRIKSRDVAVHSPHPDVRLTPQAGTASPHVRSTVRDIPADVEPAPQVRSEQPKIKARDAAAGARHGDSTALAPDHKAGPFDRPSIKTKAAYIQSQPSSAPERPAQTPVQGNQEFIRGRGRTAAMERAETRRVAAGAVPQTGKGGDAAPPVPARWGYAGGQSKHAPVAVRRPVSPGEPDTRPVREGGRTSIKTARSGRKSAERSARQTIKTAERSPRKAIKTTQRTSKTAEHTVKTAQKSAQATVKATQRAVQAAHATAKTAAATAKAAAKATVAAIKAAIAATQELIAAITAGGWVVLVVVLVICMVGLLIVSPFGIFFSDGGSSETASPAALIAQINSEYEDRLSALQTGGAYDRVELQGSPPAWVDVFAVFAAKAAGAEDGASVAFLDADMVEKLRAVFWDMTKITMAERDIEHPAEGDTPAWTETVLTITVTPRTPDDMRVFYSFTERQNKALDELLSSENRALWQDFLYGSSGEIVAVALSQVGNVGGYPYWSWYGFNSRVDWCACFVSWCADQCGYIDTGVIPKFASCTAGSNWFKDRGQWQNGNYEPNPGDLIFFDWDNKGSSGPRTICLTMWASWNG